MLVLDPIVACCRGLIVAEEPMSVRSRVAFVGGIDRIERQIVAFGKKIGVDVEVHNGRMGSSSTTRLAAIVRRSDLVVIVTGTTATTRFRWSSGRRQKPASRYES
jgi:hypothetical protein